MSKYLVFSKTALFSKRLLFTYVWLISGLVSYKFIGAFGSLVEVSRPFFPLSNGFFSPSKAIVKTFLQRMRQLKFGVQNLYSVPLSLVGIGYKVFTPRRWNFKFMVLKLGFGGSGVECFFL